MAKFVMLHDENLCIGCQACSVACRMENQVSDGVYRLQVQAKSSGVFPRVKIDFERKSCAMCENSPCVDVCPTGASFKTRDGITLIDKKLCVSCKYCVLACPYDARYVDPKSFQINKENIKYLLILDLRAILLELPILFILFAGMYFSEGVARESMALILGSGVYGGLLYLGVIGVGLLFPIVIAFTVLKSHDYKPFYIAINSLAVLIGVILLRFFIVYAGQAYTV